MMTAVYVIGYCAHLPMGPRKAVTALVAAPYWLGIWASNYNVATGGLHQWNGAIELLMY